MKTFFEAERQCQCTFNMCGKIFHACTSGKDMPILFTTDEDLAFVMNVIAYAAYKFNGIITILAFEVMNNHFHFVICGNEEDIEAFFNCVVKKLKRSFPMAGEMKLKIIPVNNLAMARNVIVYNNRNGYVANPRYTPFSYPWGTGKYYFNDVRETGIFGDVGYTLNRKMFRGSNVTLPKDWKIIDGYIAPSSYCAIELGKAIFRDAHHYFAAVGKNVEAYSEVASDIEDGEFLTDTELFSLLRQKVIEQYHIANLRELTKAQRLDLARTLHYDYQSSNGQIRRILGLTQYEVDSLFPLGKGQK